MSNSTGSEGIRNY